MIAQATIGGAGVFHRAGEAFENCFDLVMVGSSIQNSCMNIGLRSTGKAVEEIMHQFGLQIVSPMFPCVMSGFTTPGVVVESG